MHLLLCAPHFSCLLHDPCREPRPQLPPLLLPAHCLCLLWLRCLIWLLLNLRHLLMLIVTVTQCHLLCDASRPDLPALHAHVPTLLKEHRSKFPTCCRKWTRCCAVGHLWRQTTVPHCLLPAGHAALLNSIFASLLLTCCLSLH
jgi:hypothetical protein